MTSQGQKTSDTTPGSGIRSTRTTSIFRLLNFELYTKPNKVIMAIGLVGMTGAMCYIAYMRHKYEKMGYYAAVQDDGTEVFMKKKSKWDS